MGTWTEGWGEARGQTTGLNDDRPDGDDYIMSHRCSWALLMRDYVLYLLYAIQTTYPRTATCGLSLALQYRHSQPLDVFTTFKLDEGETFISYREHIYLGNVEIGLRSFLESSNRHSRGRAESGAHDACEDTP